MKDVEIFRLSFDKSAFLEDPFSGWSEQEANKNNIGIRVVFFILCKLNYLDESFVFSIIIHFSGKDIFFFSYSSFAGIPYVRSFFLFDVT